MDWRGRRRSSNIEDRRGDNIASAGAGGALLLRFIPMLLGTRTGRWILGIGVLVVLGGKMLGIDLLPLLLGGGQTVSQQSQRPLSPAEQELSEFVSVVLADTETTWHQIFQSIGRQYQEPTLVLFSNRVQSACGTASCTVILLRSTSVLRE